eukprot:Skav225313  [mRNA]  locus=scaffold4899:87294:91313:- [translate_table: standard]
MAGVWSKIPGGWSKNPAISESKGRTKENRSTGLGAEIPGDGAEIPGDGAERDDSFSRGFLHRLDVPTSGLILVAKTVAAFYDLRLQLACGALQRDRCWTIKLFATVLGHAGVKFVPLCTGGLTVAAPAVRFGRPSITTYASAKDRLRYRNGDAVSLLSIRIVTGRKHQIRVHSAHIGHPVTWLTSSACCF